jgi:hypothetical protein
MSFSDGDAIRNGLQGKEWTRTAGRSKGPTEAEKFLQGYRAPSGKRLKKKSDRITDPPLFQIGTKEDAPQLFSELRKLIRASLHILFHLPVQASVSLLEAIEVAHRRIPGPPEIENGLLHVAVAPLVRYRQKEGQVLGVGHVLLEAVIASLFHPDHPGYGDETGRAQMQELILWHPFEIRTPFLPNIGKLSTRYPYVTVDESDGRILPEYFQTALETAREENVIRIQKEEKIAFGFIETQVPGRTHALILLLEDPNSFILVTSQDLGRAIAAPIIHYDQFPVGPALIQDRSDRFP